MGDASPHPVLPFFPCNSTRMASLTETSPFEILKGSCSVTCTQCRRIAERWIAFDIMNRSKAIYSGRRGEVNKLLRIPESGNKNLFLCQYLNLLQHLLIAGVL